MERAKSDKEIRLLMFLRIACVVVVLALCAVLTMVITKKNKAEATFSLQKSDVSIAVGESINPLDFVLIENMKSSDISFRISKEDVVKINDGKIVGAKKGTAVVTIYSKTKSCLFNVSVYDISQKLAMPQNFRYENGNFMWDSVENAEGYILTINDDEVYVETTSYSASFIDNITTAKIVACGVNGGEYVDSDESEALRVLNCPTTDYQISTDENNNTSITISVTNYTQGDDYDLYLNGNKICTIGSLKTNGIFPTYTIADNSSAVSYKFEVVHRHASNESNVQSSAFTTALEITKLDCVSNVSYIASTSKITFEDNANQIVDAYEIEIVNDDTNLIVFQKDSKTNIVDVDELQSGNYTIKIRTKSSSSITSKETICSFVVPRKLQLPLFSSFDSQTKKMIVLALSEDYPSIEKVETYINGSLSLLEFSLDGETILQDKTYKRLSAIVDKTVFNSSGANEICLKFVAKQDLNILSSSCSEKINFYKEATPNQPFVIESTIIVPDGCEVYIDDEKVDVITQNEKTIVSNLSSLSKTSHTVYFISPAKERSGYFTLESERSVVCNFESLKPVTLSVDLQNEKVVCQSENASCDYVIEVFESKTALSPSKTVNASNYQLSFANLNTLYIRAIAKKDGCVCSEWTELISVEKPNLSDLQHTYTDDGMVKINIESVNSYQNYNYTVFVDGNQNNNFTVKKFDETFFLCSTEGVDINSIYQNDGEHQLKIKAIAKQQKNGNGFCLSSEKTFEITKLSAPLVSDGIVSSNNIFSFKTSSAEILVIEDENGVLITNNSYSVETLAEGEEKKIYAYFKGDNKCIIKSEKTECIFKKQTSLKDVRFDINSKVFSWEDDGDCYNISVLNATKEVFSKNSFKNCQIFLSSLPVLEAETHTFKVQKNDYQNDSTFFLKSDFSSITFSKAESPDVEISKSQQIVTVTLSPNTEDCTNILTDEVGDELQHPYIVTGIGSGETKKFVAYSTKLNWLSSEKLTLQIYKPLTIEKSKITENVSEKKITFTKDTKANSYVVFYKLSGENEWQQQTISSNVFDYSFLETLGYYDCKIMAKGDEQTTFTDDGIFVLDGEESDVFQFHNSVKLSEPTFTATGNVLSVVPPEEGLTVHLTNLTTNSVIQADQLINNSYTFSLSSGDWVSFGAYVSKDGQEQIYRNSNQVEITIHKLKSISGVNINATTKEVSFVGDSYSSEYELQYRKVGDEIWTKENLNKSNFSYASWEISSFEYKLQPIGKQYVAGENYILNGEIYTPEENITNSSNLSKIETLVYDDEAKEIKFNSVDHATKYILYANGTPIEISTNVYSLSEVTVGETSYQVKAIGDDILYFESEMSKAIKIIKAGTIITQPSVQGDVVVLTSPNENYFVEMSGVSNINSTTCEVLLADGQTAKYKLRYKAKTKKDGDTYYLDGDYSEEFEIKRLNSPQSVVVNLSGTYTVNDPDQATNGYVIKYSDELMTDDVEVQGEVITFASGLTHTIKAYSKGNNCDLLDSINFAQATVERLTPISLEVDGEKIKISSSTPLSGDAVFEMKIGTNGTYNRKTLNEINSEIKQANNTYYLKSWQEKNGYLPSNPVIESFVKMADPVVSISDDGKKINWTTNRQCDVTYALIDKNGNELLSPQTALGKTSYGFEYLSCLGNYYGDVTVELEITTSNANYLKTIYRQNFTRPNKLSVLDFSINSDYSISLPQNIQQSAKYYVDVSKQVGATFDACYLANSIYEKPNTCVSKSVFSKGSGLYKLSVCYFSNDHLMSVACDVCVNLMPSSQNICIVRGEGGDSFSQYLSWQDEGEGYQYIYYLKNSQNAVVETTQTDLNKMNLTNKIATAGQYYAYVFVKNMSSEINFSIPSEFVRYGFTKLDNNVCLRMVDGRLAFSKLSNENIEKYILDVQPSAVGQYEFSSTIEQETIKCVLQGVEGVINAKIKVYAKENSNTLDSNWTDSVSYNKIASPNNPKVVDGEIAFDDGYISQIQQISDYVVVLKNVETGDEFYSQYLNGKLNVPVGSVANYNKVVHAFENKPSKVCYYITYPNNTNNILTSDESSVITVQTLKKTESISIDTTTDVTQPKLVFKKVEHASKYKIAIYKQINNSFVFMLSDEPNLSPNLDEHLIYNLFFAETDVFSFTDGKYRVLVQSIGTNEATDVDGEDVYYFSSDEFASIDFSVLQEPEIEVFAGKIRWSEVKDASAYYVYINGEKSDIALTCDEEVNMEVSGEMVNIDYKVSAGGGVSDGLIYCDIPNKQLPITYTNGYQSFTLEVRAVSNIENLLISKASTKLTIKRPNVPTSPIIVNGNLKWESASGNYCNSVANSTDALNWYNEYSSRYEGKADAFEVLCGLNTKSTIEIEFTTENGNVKTIMVDADKFQKLGLTEICNCLNETVGEVLPSGYYSIRLRQLGNSIDMTNSAYTASQTIYISDSVSNVTLSNNLLSFNRREYSESALKEGYQGQEYLDVDYVIYAKIKENQNSSWVPIYYIDCENHSYSIYKISGEMNADGSYSYQKLNTNVANHVVCSQDVISVTLKNEDNCLLKEYSALSVVTVGNDCSDLGLTKIGYINSFRSSEIDVKVLNNPIGAVNESGVITWDSVDGAVEYYVTITYSDEEDPIVIKTGSTLTSCVISEGNRNAIGNNIFYISVRAIGNGTTTLNACQATTINNPFSLADRPLVSVNEGLVEIITNASDLYVTYTYNGETVVRELGDQRIFYDDVARVNENDAITFNFYTLGNTQELKSETTQITLNKCKSPTITNKKSASKIEWTMPDDKDYIFDVVVKETSGKTSSFKLSTKQDGKYYLDIRNEIDNETGFKFVAGTVYDVWIRAYLNNEDISASNFASTGEMVKLKTPNNFKIVDGKFIFDGGKFGEDYVDVFDACVVKKGTNTKTEVTSLVETLLNDDYKYMSTYFDEVDDGTYIFEISAQNITECLVQIIPSDVGTFEFKKESNTLDLTIEKYKNEICIKYNVSGKKIVTNSSELSYTGNFAYLPVKSESEFRIYAEGYVASRVKNAQNSITIGSIAISFDEINQSIVVDSNNKFDNYEFVFTYNTQTKHESTTEGVYKLVTAGTFSNIVCMAYTTNAYYESNVIDSAKFDLFGETTQGDGKSESTAYLITSSEDFSLMVKNMDKRPNSYFKLINNVNYVINEKIDHWNANLCGNGKQLCLSYEFDSVPNAMTFIGELASGCTIKQLDVVINQTLQCDVTIGSSQEFALSFVYKNKGKLDQVNLTGSLQLHKNSYNGELVGVYIVNINDGGTIASCTYLALNVLTSETGMMFNIETDYKKE